MHKILMEASAEHTIKIGEDLTTSLQKFEEKKSELALDGLNTQTHHFTSLPRHIANYAFYRHKKRQIILHHL